MKKVINILIVVLVIGWMPPSVHADAIDVDVPNNCTVTDTGGVSHAFPQSDSPSEHLGICMLETAKEAGSIDFTLTNDPNFGLYIQSVNSIQPGATEYWAIWDNGVSATCGIGCIPLSQNDTLSFILTDWMTNVGSTTVTLRVHSLVSPPPPPPSGKISGGGGIPNSSLNVTDALAYLVSKQGEDGSFDPPFLSDWVAIAFAAADPGDAKVKLREYLHATTPTLSSVTDYERHAMALEALNLNPYSDTSIDYITPIVNAFDGTQIGDASLDNDDIFALFPLLAAGYGMNDIIIQKTTAFILSRQGQDGSWDGNVDLTAAAIQALIPVRRLPDVSLALIRAEGYLRKEQPKNGDPGSSFSTSWARQAISALSWTPSGWTQNLFTKKDHLAELQQPDGGVEPESSGAQTRVWATAYAIPAALGKSWPALLTSFTKFVATSTPLIATSTQSEIPAGVVVNVISTEPAPNVTQNPEPGIKMSSPPSIPVLIDNQMAAVADVPTRNLFSFILNAAISFFKGVL